MEPTLFKKPDKQDGTNVWPGPGKEVVIFSVGSPAEIPRADQSTGRCSQSSKLQRARPAAPVPSPPAPVRAPNHPSSASRSIQPPSGPWGGRERFHGDFYHSLGQLSASSIGFFTCSNPSQEKKAAFTMLTCSSMPALPSVLIAYNAKVAQAPRQGAEHQALLRDGSLPSLLQKPREPRGLLAEDLKKLSGLRGPRGAKLPAASKPPSKKAALPSMLEENRKRVTAIELRRNSQRLSEAELLAAQDERRPLPEIQVAPSTSPPPPPSDSLPNSGLSKPTTPLSGSASCESPNKAASSWPSKVVTKKRLAVDHSIFLPKSDTPAPSPPSHSGRPASHQEARPWARSTAQSKVSNALRSGLQSGSGRRTSVAALSRTFETTDKQIEHDAFVQVVGSSKGEMLYENIVPAMTLMGYRDVQEDWVREIHKSLIKDQSPLKFDEFRAFVEAYHKRHHDELVAEFKMVDLDGSGKINAGEVSVYLEKCGITVVPGIVRELLHEIKSDTHAELASVDDYILLREIIQYRGGFTTREVEMMARLHDRFDQTKTGALNVEELEAAMLWLYFPTEEERPDGHFAHIALEGMSIDFDNTHGLTLEEFLQVMRRRREYNIRCLSQLVQEYATHTGTINVASAANVLQRLGYCTASPDCIEAYAAENGVGHQGVYHFDDMYLIMQTFQGCEGFLRSEIEEFEKEFQAHDADDSGAIGVVELGSILSSMGFRVDLDEQQRLMDEVDLDDSGEIDFDEFLKLLRRYREDEVHTLEKAFHNPRNNGKLTACKIRCLLPALGYNRLSTGQNEIIESTAGNKELDFRQTVEMMRKLRDFESHDFHEHFGFTPAQEASYRKLFRSFCRRTSIANQLVRTATKDALQPQEVISGDALQGLIASCFRDLMTDPHEQEEVDRIMTCHRGRHPEGSTFTQTLEVLRMVQDRESYLAILKENEMAVAKGFSRQEVRDFRMMFRLCDCDAAKDVSLPELLMMFSTMMPMSPEVQAALRPVILESSKKAMKSKKFAFPDFLELMHHMLKVTAQQLEETSAAEEAAAAAAAEEQQQQLEENKQQQQLNEPGDDAAVEVAVAFPSEDTSTTGLFGEDSSGEVPLLRGVEKKKTRLRLPDNAPVEEIRELFQEKSKVEVLKR